MQQSIASQVHQDTSSNKQQEYSKAEKLAKETHTQVLKLSNGTFIRKTTAVWLFQGECVSLGRLFRVRTKQQYFTLSSVTSTITSCDIAEQTPHVSETVNMGDICIFDKGNQWELGCILQFAYYERKKISAYQYKGSTASVNESDLGALHCKNKIVILTQNVVTSVACV